MELDKYKNNINNFYKTKKRMPSYSEMLSLFNLKSKNAIYRIVNKLVDSGFIDKDPSGKITPGNIFNEIPLVGLVKAGAPAQGDTIEDTLDIENYLIPKKENTFLLTVDGDSMIEAHIEDGDIVIVEKSNSAKDGEIIVAQVDGEFTMKYFKKSGNKIWLEPANKNYKPIYPTYELNIIGIIKGVMRKY